MQLVPKHYDVILDSFLNSWNIERIRNMTIQEYADLSNHDSLCYWLEYGTKELGAIGRISLNKFELWRPREIEGKEFKDGRYKLEGDYAWNAKKGDSLDQAFFTIRKLVIDIVTNSQNQNWRVIDDIKFHAIGKWKLACLFSQKQLLPVYSKRALLAIASGLGHAFRYGDRISDIQAIIIAHKSDDEDLIDFSYRMYTKFASRDKISNRNYFLIGSKYADENGDDSVSILDQFIKHGCVAMDWIDWVDFGGYIGGDKKAVNAFVADNWSVVQPKLSKVQGYFRLLSQIKPGDIIAVKSQGAYGQLKIIAYAEVVERGDGIYWHDQNLLGHHIHVEFLDAGFVNDTGATYAGTLHCLTPEKDGPAFYKIFGWYAADPSDADQVQSQDRVEVYPDEADDEGYNEKTEASFQRSAIASVTVNRVHNRIQNRFVKYLNEVYPDDICSGEKKNIDAKRITDEKMFIYEIKPFSSVYACIREGIGQLLGYMHQEKTAKLKHIIIVGPNEPNAFDLQFLDEIKKTMNVPFTYLAFDEKAMTAQEY